MNHEGYVWRCHLILGEVRGLLFVTSAKKEEDFSFIDRYMSAFSKQCDLLELEKRLHSNLAQDVSTERVKLTRQKKRNSVFNMVVGNLKKNVPPNTKLHVTNNTSLFCPKWKCCAA